jgi:hypothetical protein
MEQRWLSLEAGWSAEVVGIHVREVGSGSLLPSDFQCGCDATGRVANHLNPLACYILGELALLSMRPSSMTISSNSGSVCARMLAMAAPSVVAPSRTGSKNDLRGMVPPG